MSMKIGILINPNAGHNSFEYIKSQIETALFRCQLDFFRPSFENYEHYLTEKLGTTKYDGLVVAGGDGTVNKFLNMIAKLHTYGYRIPTISIISTGTANDFASEMKIKNKIISSARSLLSGQEKRIDIVSVSSKHKTAYMLTSGGIGIASQTASTANHMKSKIKKMNLCNDSFFLNQLIGNLGKKALQKWGHHIYTLAFIHAANSWTSKNWKIKISLSQKEEFETHAPFILINNQSRVGHSFVPAPFTNNSDGTFNLWVSEMGHSIESYTNILDIRNGYVQSKNGLNKSFEIEHCKISSVSPDSSFNFFGDGEILLENINSAEISILKQFFPLAVNS